MFGQRTRILIENAENVRGVMRFEIQSYLTCFRSGQKQQFLDDLAQSRNLLQLNVYGLFIDGIEIAVHQELFGLKSYQGKRCLQFVRRLRGEAANLLERRFQAIEHLVQQQGQFGDLVADLRHRNPLAEIVGTDMAPRLSHTPYPGPRGPAPSAAA